jgi:hypothetical protein
VHLLENGASVRHIQQLLGHAKLSSTQKCLAVIPSKLKKVHAAAHPAERNVKPQDTHPRRRIARGGIHRAERRIDRILQRELAAVSTETAPCRSPVMSIDATSTNRASMRVQRRRRRDR